MGNRFGDMVNPQSTYAGSVQSTYQGNPQYNDGYHATMSYNDSQPSTAQSREQNMPPPVGTMAYEAAQYEQNLQFDRTNDFTGDVNDDQYYVDEYSEKADSVIDYEPEAQDTISTARSRTQEEPPPKRFQTSQAVEASMEDDTPKYVEPIEPVEQEVREWTPDEKAKRKKAWEELFTPKFMVPPSELRPTTPQWVWRFRANRYGTPAERERASVRCRGMSDPQFYRHWYDKCLKNGTGTSSSQVGWYPYRLANSMPWLMLSRTGNSKCIPRVPDDWKIGDPLPVDVQQNLEQDDPWEEGYASPVAEIEEEEEDKKQARLAWQNYKKSESYKTFRKRGVCHVCLCIGHWAQSCRKKGGGLYEPGKPTKSCKHCGSANHTDCPWQEYGCTACGNKRHMITRCPEEFMQARREVYKEQAEFMPEYYPHGRIPTEKQGLTRQAYKLARCFDPKKRVLM